MTKKFEVDLDSLAVPEYSSDEEVAGGLAGEEEVDDEKINKSFKFGVEKRKFNDWDFFGGERDSLEKVKGKRGEGGEENEKSGSKNPEEEEESADEEAEDESDEESSEKSPKGSAKKAKELEKPAEEFTMNNKKNDATNQVEVDTEEQIAEFFESSTVADSRTTISFTSLKLSRPVLKSLAELNYLKPTPIQMESIPVALMGKDIVAGAETGSGKTAAYMIPIIERLLYKPSKISKTRVIVLTPTRELSIQVSDVVRKLSKYAQNVTLGLAVGGLNLRKQEQQLKSKPDIVVATPGRFIDHVRNSPSFNVDSVEVLVMDEADRMLEEGFQKELTEILSLLPRKKQTLLFSATMNSRIQSLVQLSMNRPVRIMVDSPTRAAGKLVQEFVRIRKRDNLKPGVLTTVLKDVNPKQQHRVVVFVSRKETAKRLKAVLEVVGIKAGELHGALSQEQRLVNVSNFKTAAVPVLVCTDLAARGLDIPKIEMVINYDMPKSYEIYLHRVGRTARANREGRSVSFVGESTGDRSIVKSALKSLEETSKKAVSRKVDWNQVEDINKVIEDKTEEIEELLELEKQKKEIEVAQRDIQKGENLLKHQEEIQSRPKRTWFENSEKDKGKINRKKRKRLEETGNTKNFGKAAKASAAKNPTKTGTKNAKNRK